MRPDFADICCPWKFWPRSFGRGSAGSWRPAMRVVMCSLAPPSTAATCHFAVRVSDSQGLMREFWRGFLGASVQGTCLAIRVSAPNALAPSPLLALAMTIFFATSRFSKTLSSTSSSSTVPDAFRAVRTAGRVLAGGCSLLTVPPLFLHLRQKSTMACRSPRSRFGKAARPRLFVLVATASSHCLA